MLAQVCYRLKAAEEIERQRDAGDLSAADGG